MSWLAPFWSATMVIGVGFAISSFALHDGERAMAGCSWLQWRSGYAKVVSSGFS
jgi:hypothetical protein